MPNLQDIRQQYPQYNDLSDEQLADGFHKKYYSDIPREEFNKKIGLSIQAPQPEQAISSEFPSAEKMVNDPITGRIISGVGALSSGGANIAQGIADTPVFVLKNLKLISPETADKLYKANKENSDLFRPDSGAWGDGQPDVFTQGKKEYPYTHMGVKLATDTAGLVGSMRAIPAIGAAISGAVPSAAATASGVAARAGTMGLIGQATAEPEDKEKSFALNAAMSPAFDAVGAVVGSLGNKATTIKAITDIASTVTPKKVKAAYKVVEKLPWDESMDLGVKSIAQNIDEVLKTPTNLLKTQTKMLGNLQESLMSVKTSGDLLNISQQFNKTLYKQFKGLSVGPSAKAALDKVKNGMEDILNQAAIKNGVAGALSKAKDISRASKEVNKAIDPLKAMPETFNFNTATKNIKLALNQYKGKPEFKKTVETLEGLSKLTAEAGRYKSLGGLALFGIGSAVGGGAAYSITGDPVITGVASALGGATGLVLKNTLTSYAYSPEGQEFLRGLKKPGVTQQDIRNVFRAIVTTVNNALPGSTSKEAK